MTNWDVNDKGLKPRKSAAETRAELVQQAMAAAELRRRYDENRICYVRPCGPKHLAFLNSNKIIRIVFGGNRSGKSFLGMTELLYRACMKYHPITKEPNPKNGRYRIFTTKFQVAEEFILPLLREFIPKKCLIKGSFKESYDSRYHILRLANGNMIDIMTYDQETTVTASVALHGVWADEEMPERMFSETMTRLISTKGKLWLTVTPLYSLTWAMKYWERHDDPNVDVFRISIHDNPHLPRTERDAIIANWPENERAARESGEFLEFAGLVYKELDNHVHVVAASQPEPGYPVIFALDPHPRKATVCTWAFITPQDDVVFFDELEMKGTAGEIASAIRAKESSHKAPTSFRIIDPAAKAQGSNLSFQLDTLQEFEKAGMSFALADNSEAGYNVCHEYFGWDKTQPTSSLNRPRCFITRDCPKIWDGLTHFMWDEWAHGNTLRDEKERPKDFKKDFPDCVRYTLVGRPRFSYGSHSSPIVDSTSSNAQLEREAAKASRLLGGKRQLRFKQVKAA